MKKNNNILSVLMLAVVLLGFNYTALAQSNNGQSLENKKLMGGIIVEEDTFPLGYIPPVFIEDQMSPEDKLRLARLRYNVTKVYPYAITAAYIIDKVDDEISVKNSKRDRRKYIKTTHKDLNDKFKEELKSLTITQGQILVKLINRETGRDAYSIIKELKGGLNARVSQTMAGLFKNNLKAKYDPYGADMEIEMIVQEIEKQNYMRYQSHLLEQKAAMNNPATKK